MNPSGTQAPAATPAPDTSFFVTGGTVPTDAPSYIERAADRELLACLLEGRLCYVLTSRQMGKSSLMARTALKLQERGVNTITLDFSAVGQNLTVPQWYAGLIAHVGRQLRIENELDDFWDHRREFGPCQRFFAALTDAALPALADRNMVTPSGSPRLVIFVDELDTVRSLPFKSDEFFAAVRELYNRRTADPALRGITFCLLGVATPSDLIRDQKITPFNVGTRIELHDFNPREAAPLARGLSGPLSAPGQPQQVLERVLHWTGGHPYLTQRLCRAISGAGLHGRVGPADVDRLCDQLFLSDEARERDDNLAFVRERILRAESDRVAALVRYREILRHPGRVRLDELDPPLAQLRLAGIVRAERGRMRVRNRIYERVFNDAWIRKNLPDAEVIRQRRAFWGGVIRAAAVALPTLALIAGLALWAVSQKRESQRALVRLNVETGGVRMEQGDYLATLPYFVHALGLEENMGGDGRVARIRIGAVLDASPQLRFLLPHDAPVVDVAYASNSAHLFSGTSGGEVVAWDAKTGTRIAEVKGANRAVHHLQVGDDGRHFAAHYTDESVELFELTGTNTIAARWTVQGVGGLAFVPGTSDLVVGTGNRVLRRPAGAAGEAELLFTGDRDVKTLGVDSTGRRIAVALRRSGEQELAVLEGPDWRASTLSGQGLGKAADGKNFNLVTNAARLTGFEFSPDGRWLVGCGYFDHAFVWDLERPAGPPTSLPHGKPGSWGRWVRTCQFSQDGRRLITSCADGMVLLWEVGTWRSEPPLAGHRHDVYQAVFNSRGTMAASASADGTARIWSLEDRERGFPPLYHGNFVMAVAFSPDEQQLASASLDGTVRIWAPPAGLQPDWLDVDWNKDESLELGQVAAAPAAGRVATLTTSQGARFIDLWSTGQERRAARIVTDERTAELLAMDAAGRFAVAAAAKSVGWWDATSGRHMGGFATDTNVTALALSWTGELLAVGLANGLVELHRLPGGERVGGRFSGAGAANHVLRMSFNADGTLLAVAGRQDSEGDADESGLWVFQVPSGELLAGDYVGTSARVVDLSFSPGRADEMAFALTTRGQKSLKAAIVRVPEVSESGIQLEHWDGVLALAFSQDGGRIATASEDGTIQVWRVADGRRESARSRLGRYHARLVAFGPPPAELLLGVWSHPTQPRLLDSFTGGPVMPPIESPGQVVGLGFSEDGRGLFLVDRRRGVGLFRLPEEARSVSELQALALLLAPGKPPEPRDGPLTQIADRINRGKVTRADWEVLWRDSRSEARPGEVRWWR